MRAALTAAFAAIGQVWANVESHHKMMLLGAAVFLASIWFGAIVIALSNEIFIVPAWITTIMGAVVGIVFFFRGAGCVDL